MTVYLTEKQIEKINALVIQRYSPKEQIQTVSPSALNMIVNLPEQFVFGKPLYPTIFDKATILFVQLIKKHVFANANKRTAFFVLVKFLQLNGYHFTVSVEEAVDMCVTIAVEALTDEKMINYSKWISEHSIREKVKK
ncbi:MULTISPECIES: type II toxin-antitoxin system death-on-curing family toxin [Streptococcus]|jgi:death-on-curing family protein|uniref:Death on curing protein, Doc toxin n=3 Tax=Streptococcus TaxID=1301 RepID=A0A139MC98_STROR|nr:MULTISPECIES: type II toxin-antitoxin system death-on-curing family toxin [Streptococcus]KXT61252.1 Death on curing protein, Doc toxin [Streptococcus oralis]ORO76544.1 death-on-curing protein [Streptococcus oralis subsp. dentisani]RSJ05390.1 Toxin Doc [Streptococcus mitis]RSJ65316.1 Toxin Doc [Streptococcus oralis]